MFLVTNEDVLAAALSLDRKERAELAHRLIVSLDPEGEELPEAECEAAWVQESERRLQDLREGSAKEIPASEVFARARALVDAPPGPPSNATTAKRILRTPTPGQDLTRTLFPPAPARKR
jgi:putative addiction module component (TIGR02574 family)